MSNIQEIYPFTQIKHGLIAFLTNFDNKINGICKTNIPVYLLETGDESFWFSKKFEHKKDETRENYLSVPRITFNIDSVEMLQDQDTNQYIKMNYFYDKKTFKTQARRKAMSFPFNCNFVVSNFVMMLEYLEILLSVTSIDNVFTYEYLGNTYAGSYNAQTVIFEKIPMENGGTKNFVIKATIDVQLQPQIVKPESIQDISDFDNNGKEIKFDIITRNHELFQIDHIILPDAEDVDIDTFEE